MKNLTRLIILWVALLFASSPMVSAQSSSAESQRQSLGVNVEETGYGLTVRSVILGSAAVGQLETGDVLQFLSADGHPVYATLTLQQMRIAKEAIGLDVPGYLQIQRGGVTRVFDVEFASSGTIIGNGRVMSIDDALLSSRDIAKPASGSMLSAMASNPQAAPSLSFDRMILAELQEGKDSTEMVVLTKPRWAEEKMEYAFTVTLMTQVTKERTKKIPKAVVVDGKAQTVYEDVVEQCTVNVPVTEERTGVRSIMKPVEGSERVEVPIDAVRAWSIGGKLLSSTELKSQFRGTKHVFVLPSGFTEYFADPFFTTAVSNDALVIAAPLELGPLPALVSPTPPDASAAPNQYPPAIAAPVAEAPAPPAAEAAPPAAEATPLEAPPADPDLPSTDAPVEGSSPEN